MSASRLVAVVVGTVAVLAATPAPAGETDGVLSRLGGRILVVQGQLPVARDAMRRIEAFQEQDTSVLRADAGGDARTWAFQYMAFLSEKPRTHELSLEFYAADGTWVASERILDVSPRVSVLTGRASLGEGEGLERGAAYEVRLVAERRGKEIVLARTTLTTT